MNDDVSKMLTLIMVDVDRALDSSGQRPRQSSQFSAARERNCDAVSSTVLATAGYVDMAAKRRNSCAELPGPPTKEQLMARILHRFATA
jgi:hypothetical protein